MRRIRENAAWLGLGLLMVLASFGGCAGGSESTTGSVDDAGSTRPDVGSIDPVSSYGQGDAGLVVGPGGPGQEVVDGAVTLLEGGTAVGVVINEVDYEQVGTDAAEFVEIYNPTASTLDLANVALVLVSSSSEYGRVDLAGPLGPGKYLLVASPNVSGPDAGVSRLPLPTSTNALRNGPAAVGLLDKSTGTLLDALSYGGAVTAATVTGVMMPRNFVEGMATPAVDSNSAAGSLSRLPNGADTNNATADFKFTTTPTPGKPNIP